MNRLGIGIGVAAFLLGVAAAGAQTTTNLAILRGLAPVSALSNSDDGKVALGSNFTVTGGIQTGDIRQPTLLPFKAQQQQALRDAFITDGNLTQLADGLGTTLGAAYQARARYIDRERNFTSISESVRRLIAYANATTGADSNSGKYFFANATTNGTDAVSDEAKAIFAAIHGAPDPFGRAYGRPGGSPGADAYGDSRPFQTEPRILPIVGPDYFNVPASNEVYNRGPIMNLVNSPSFPSGHTTYGYMGSIVLAVLVPDRYQEMMARAAEYGNDRIVMGAHYAMDVLGGRTLATYDLAHLLANDPVYLNRKLKDVAMMTATSQPDLEPIADFRAAVAAARSDLTQVLEAACGDTVAICARQDIGRFNAPAMNEAFYMTTQTYGLAIAHRDTADNIEDVGALAPEAGNLLTAAFPKLSLEEANRILTETEGPGGGFLDDGSAFGVYSRLNLYAAAGRAAALSRAKP